MARRFLTIIISLSFSPLFSQTYKQGEYKTSDGKSFINADEAKKHQNSLEAGQLQKAIIGNSGKVADEKERQKEKLAKNVASDADFARQQREEKGSIANIEFQKVRSKIPNDPKNVSELTSINHNYNNNSDYIKAMCVLSVAKPIRLPHDYTDIIGKGSLFSSQLTEDEIRVIIKEILKNTEYTEMFATSDEGAEKVFQKYCSDSTTFADEILPKLMTYLKKRSQDYVYKASAYKIKTKAGIKWLNDNGISREYDPFKELKENSKKTLKVNDGISEYGTATPKRVLEEIENSGYKPGSDPEMELLRGIALYRVRKFRESGEAFAIGWPYYQNHSKELSLTYPINAMHNLPFHAKFAFAAEASITYFNAYPEWNSLATDCSTLILEGQDELAEIEFKQRGNVVKIRGSKSYSLGTEKDTRELMDACIYFKKKKYKKAYKIFKENKWIGNESYFYGIMYHICAKSCGEKTPSLIVDATECTKPEWIDQATWDLGKRD